MSDKTTDRSFVLAAGGLFCFFVGLGFGYWFWRRSHATPSALQGLDLGLLGAMTPPLGPGFAAPLLPITHDQRHDLPPPRAFRPIPPPTRSTMRHDAAGRPDVERGFYVTPFTIGATAVEIVSRSAAGDRRVRIATDQPIRIGNGSGLTVDPSRGMPIMPGEQPFDLGVIPAGSRLFAVVPLGGVVANVSLSSQLVG
jgi:hypothetical protein